MSFLCRLARRRRAAHVGGVSRPLVASVLFALIGSSVVTGAEVKPTSPVEAIRRELDGARGRYENVPDSLRWATLVVGEARYPRARVRSFDTWNAVVFYDRGIVTVPLARLPVEARRTLGYDDAHPPAPPPPPPVMTRAPEPPKAAVKPKPYVIWRHDPVARTLIAFGTRPQVRASVDLRSDFEQMGLTAKNQGESPSCAVYAVTAAMEYHRVMSGGTAVRLSEPYLYWASLRSLGRTQDRRDAGELHYEGGLGLTEVVQALRSYGIPPAGRLPGNFNPQEDTPDARTQEEAWGNSRVGYIMLNGRTKRERLEQAVLALNEGLPVVIGMVWPESSPDFARTGDVCDRPARAGYGHAVLLTGYSSPDGSPENTVFRFRNSYGEKWGDKGYGTVPWSYLIEHCYDGLFLDAR